MPSLVRGRCPLFLSVSAAAIVLAAGFAAGPPGDKEAKPAPPARTPWTTSRVVGSPDPPPPHSSRG